ncbi:MAG: UDP-3-O-acyl-N-acetylglucosamine deacetylase, partial [Candidatus Cloacimonadaceae bacterium]|nr:UDP-3-O-acyl-N-acetylglucosamine deacetylase [Candidatus Cloacimonadaceae bacterium]
MSEFKHTICSAVSYTGIGLHSGEISTICFKPAGPEEGIVFIRVDLPGKPEIPADIDHVVDISR